MTPNLTGKTWRRLFCRIVCFVSLIFVISLWPPLFDIRTSVNAVLFIQKRQASKRLSINPFPAESLNTSLGETSTSTRDPEKDLNLATKKENLLWERQKTSEPVPHVDHVPNKTAPLKIERIIVVAYFRSGSSFLGEILSQAPRTFYHFEPLYFYASTRGARVINMSAGLTVLSAIFRCDFHGATDYLERGKSFIYPFAANQAFWLYCGGEIDVCFDAAIMSQFCQMCTRQVMKVIRLSLRQVRKWINANTDIGGTVKVVHLVRDPRGIWSSRLRRSACQYSSGCRRIEALCKRMREDLDEFEDLKEAFPDQFVQVRYEDVALEPTKRVRLLFDQLRLTFTEQVSQFIRTHTRHDLTRKPRAAFSTKRNSAKAAFRWTRRLNYSQAASVQNACPDVFRRLGYRVVTSEAEYRLSRGPSFVLHVNSGHK
ncbi:unnamed protein product [Ixodes persulcatus]